MWRFMWMAAVFGLTCLVAPAAFGCDVMYRIWQDGHNTFYRFGENIYLEPGTSAHLYIHSKSKSKNPYSTAAHIGAPADFGVGSHRRGDVERVVRLGTHDQRKGKQELTVRRAGETALGYQITAVKSPGRLEQIPVSCRTGQVRITVVD